MWLFTKHGFFSAVQNWDDANLIHVRARFQGDLEKLCEEYGVAHTYVGETPPAQCPACGGAVSDELLDNIRLITVTLEGMKEDAYES